jgi:uncharacterized protein YjiS (DUF1127 family)
LGDYVTATTKRTLEDRPMTAIDTTLRATGFAVAPHLTRAIETIAERLMAARRRQITRIALEKLSDRELDDIGLTRGDIYARF